MDKQSISEAISNAKLYAKNLKISIQNPQHLSQNEISNGVNYYDMDIHYSQTNFMAFNKTKSKMQSTTLFNESSPAHSKNSKNMGDKSLINISSKIMTTKKEIQSENERENAFQKSQNRIQIKHLSNLLAGSLGSKQSLSKKNGHSHTYTYLNDAESQKFSEIQNSFSMKNQKINRVRHSKSPSKERHVQHNNTIYAQESNKVSHLNQMKMIEPQQYERGKKMQVGELLLQINRLEQIIKKYKGVIMEMKQRYHEIQDKLKDKLMNDHFIDVLKIQIEQLQDRNNALNSVIADQQERINSFQNKFMESITKLNEAYTQKLQKCIQVGKQNEILKELLLIATNKQSVLLKGNSIQQPQLQKYKQRNKFLEPVAKSVQKFSSKWM